MPRLPPLPSSSVAPGQPVPSRRALLRLAGGLGALAGLGTTGCAALEPEASPGTAARPSTSPAPAPLSPDVVLATTALAEIRACRRAAAATAARFPAAGGPLAGTVAMHRAHEATLVDAVPEEARPPRPPAPYEVPGRRALAEATLLRREQQLQALLGGLAVQARSGDVARLLGSMSAGVAQRVATWPT